MRTLLRTIGKGALLSVLLSLAPVASHAAESYGPSASPAAIAPQVVQQSATQAASLLAGRISQAVSNAIGGGGFGGGFGGTPQAQILGGNSKAAGDPVNKTALWMNVGNAWVSNDQTGVDYSGTIMTVLVGVDHQFSDSTLAGVAFGYERPDITTDFNNGTFEGNNFSVSPYASYIFNDIFSVNGSIGYAEVDYDTSRLNNTVTGDISGHRFFTSVNANAVFQVEGWNLENSLGYMYLYEVQDAHSETGPGAATIGETQVRLGQWRLSTQAGYPMEMEWGSLMPYGLVRLEYDSSHTPAGVADAFGTPVANDRFGATFGLGAQAVVGDDTYLSIEGTTTQFRQHLDVYGLTGTLRIKF